MNGMCDMCKHWRKQSLSWGKCARLGNSESGLRLVALHLDVELQTYASFVCVQYEPKGQIEREASNEG